MFVYRALQAPPEYIGFVVLGGAMTAFWLNVDVDDGRAAVLGEGPGQPRALLHGARCNLMSVLLGMAVGGLLS